MMSLVETLLDLQIPKAIKISPNAQQIVYSTTTSHSNRQADDHPVSAIWLARTGVANSARQITSGSFKDEDPKWWPDGTSIMFVSDRAKQGESSAIYRMSSDGRSAPEALTPAENECAILKAEISPDGRFVVFISADENSEEKKTKIKQKDDPIVWGEDWPFGRLRLLDVATRSVGTLVSRDSHAIDLAWNDDGTKIAFTETRTPDEESGMFGGTQISVFDLSDKSVTALCTFPNDVHDLTWAGDSIYFIGKASGTSNAISSRSVYTVNLENKSTEYERLAYGEDNCAWELQKAGRDVIVKVKQGLESQVRMLNANSIFRKSKEIEAWHASFTTESDEIVLAIAQGDINSPPEVYSTTASGGAMVKLSNHGDSLQGRSFAGVNFLSCPSTSVKGEEPSHLDGLYLTPQSRITSSSGDHYYSGPLPTVVLVHGGPYNRNTNQFVPNHYFWHSVLLEAGYGILLIDYRGSSGRGEAFAAHGRGTCGIYDYADVITLTQHVIEQGFADRERLVVAGWSHGGYLSFLSCMRNGQHAHGWKWKAAIAGAGVSDCETMTLTGLLGHSQDDLVGGAPWKTDRSDVRSRVGSPLWEFKAAAEKGDVVPPILMIHGEKDKVCPLEQAVGMRRALERYGLPFEFVVYPREGHRVQERRHIVDMTERVLIFVNKHIGDAP